MIRPRLVLFSSVQLIRDIPAVSTTFSRAVSAYAPRFARSLITIPVGRTPSPSPSRPHAPHESRDSRCVSGGWQCSKVKEAPTGAGEIDGAGAEEVERVCVW